MNLLHGYRAWVAGSSGSDALPAELNERWWALHDGGARHLVGLESGIEARRELRRLDVRNLHTLYETGWRNGGTTQFVHLRRLETDM